MLSFQQSLRLIPDTPSLLYMQGVPLQPNERSITVIGARELPHMEHLQRSRLSKISAAWMDNHLWSRIWYRCIGTELQYNMVGAQLQ